MSIVGQTFILINTAMSVLTEIIALGDNWDDSKSITSKPKRDDHLGTGTLVGARLVDARFFAAPVSLAALVPVLALTRRRVHVALATILLLLITFLFLLFFIVPFIGGCIGGGRHLTSWLTFRLKKVVELDSSNIFSTSIPVHPFSWQNMESLVLLEIAYPACYKR